jgi:hypothetical protein
MMEKMANIAIVFHWSPREMREMTIDELEYWHKLALERASLRE